MSFTREELLDILRVVAAGEPGSVTITCGCQFTQYANEENIKMSPCQPECENAEAIAEGCKLYGAEPHTTH